MPRLPAMCDQLLCQPVKIDMSISRLVDELIARATGAGVAVVCAGDQLARPLVLRGEID